MTPVQRAGKTIANDIAAKYRAGMYYAGGPAIPLGPISSSHIQNKAKKGQSVQKGIATGASYRAIQNAFRPTGTGFVLDYTNTPAYFQDYYIPQKAPGFTSLSPQHVQLLVAAGVDTIKDTGLLIRATSVDIEFQYIPAVAGAISAVAAGRAIAARIGLDPRRVTRSIAEALSKPFRLWKAGSSQREIQAAAEAAERAIGSAGGITMQEINRRKEIEKWKERSTTSRIAINRSTGRAILSVDQLLPPRIDRLVDRYIGGGKRIATPKKIVPKLIIDTTSTGRKRFRTTWMPGVVEAPRRAFLDRIESERGLALVEWKKVVRGSLQRKQPTPISRLVFDYRKEQALFTATDYEEYIRAKYETTR